MQINYIYTNNSTKWYNSTIKIVDCVQYLLHCILYVVRYYSISDIIISSATSGENSSDGWKASNFSSSLRVVKLSVCLKPAIHNSSYWCFINCTQYIFTSAWPEYPLNFYSGTRLQNPYYKSLMSLSFSEEALVALDKSSNIWREAFTRFAQ